MLVSLCFKPSTLKSHHSLVIIVNLPLKNCFNSSSVLPNWGCQSTSSSAGNTRARWGLAQKVERELEGWVMSLQR
ncbi:Protein kinase superfamily protein [Prunus dulcis]|uniref:Protein kinase superfamily protein n=1 Tax=Prunus dulcis TaxID=3755 RepID=A0A5H2XTF5_PRUDU|nr:Protein kinase superfamily protein [Prunus dulcis]